MKKFGVKLTVRFLAGLCLVVMAGCGNKPLAVRTNRNGTQAVALPGYGENTGYAAPWTPVPETSPPAVKTETELKAPSGASVPEDLTGTGGGKPEAFANSAGEEPAPFRKILLEPDYAARNETVEIREKMFIAQVNDVYLNPEDYMGKTLKLEGLFQIQHYYGTDPYYFVIRYGPGCCGNDGNAGFEVLWDEAFLKEPAGEEELVYPGEGDWVEATGVLGAYEEDGYPYLCIALSSLKVMDERGAEFVTQ
jgi:hypothetical protein